LCSGGSCVTVAPPRQVAPLSTALVTSQSPTFHWTLATGTTGAQVDICSTRACGTVLQTFTATGASGSPSTALGQGTYFWRLHGALNGIVASGTSPVWEVRVGARSSAVDRSWGTIVDPNGDGFADVLVAAQAATTASFFASTGKAGVTTTPISLSAGGSTSAASAGDVNGDGFADVVVGWDSGGATSGSVSVYMGGPGGPATTAALTLIGPGGGGSTFGGAVASAGDIDGDGYADVVVGAKRDPNLNGVSVGAIYIYRGSATGLSSAPSTRIQAPASGYFGGAVASAGDVDGNGYADVIVGAPLSNAAYVYLGSAAGLSSTNVVTYSGAASSSFGSSVSGADDLNGDGYADIIVGAPGSASGAAGAAFVYLGSASGLGTTAVNPASKLPNSNFGSSVAGAGDVNGDGFADVIVGGYSSTEACIYQGSATTVVPFGAFVSPVTVLGGGSEFGIWVAGLGDVDGNGYSDVAVGSISAPLATVFNGAAIGVSSTAAASLPGPTGGTGICVE
jgi:hypothetical protein